MSGTGWRGHRAAHPNDAHKTVYRRFIEEGFNQGRLATLDEVLVPTYVNHTAPPGSSSGADGVKQIITVFRSAFPDLTIQIHEPVTEGDWVCSRAVAPGSGTSTTNRMRVA